MFCPLDQILVDESLPELNNLLMKLSELANLKQIAAKKGMTYLVEIKLTLINFKFKFISLINILKHLL